MSLMSPVIETKRNLRLSPFIEPLQYSATMHEATVFASTVEIRRLKESAEECCRFIRDAGNLVRCLAVEFEIKLGLGAAVVPIAKTLQHAPSEGPLRKRGTCDGDAHTRRLPGQPAFFHDRFSGGDDAACNETSPAFILACEDEDCIALGDALSTIHRLLRTEREGLRRRISNLGFDRERHFWPPLTNSRYSSQNAETFFSPALRRTSKSATRVSG